MGLIDNKYIGYAAIAAAAYFALRVAKSRSGGTTTGSIAGDIGFEVGSAVSGAVASGAVGAVEGVVVGIGDAVGLPRPTVQACTIDLQNGDVVGASAHCSVGVFSEWAVHGFSTERAKILIDEINGG